MHDDLADIPAASMFPYTTWDEIPNYNSVNTGQVCKTDNPANKLGFSSIILSIPLYI